MRKTSPLAWVWLLLGSIYLLVPLIATLQFSLQAQMRAGIPISLDAYVSVLTSTDFFGPLLFSFGAAILTIALSMMLLIPTTYWIYLKMPYLIPILEFLTLLPIVIPVI